MIHIPAKVFKLWKELSPNAGRLLIDCLRLQTKHNVQSMGVNILPFTLTLEDISFTVTANTLTTIRAELEECGLLKEIGRRGGAKIWMLNLD